MGGQKPGPKSWGVDIVKTSLDVYKEGGDLQSGSLERLDFMRECEAGVSGTEPGEGAALVWV